LKPTDVDTKSPISVEGPNYVISGTDIPIFGGNAGWANREEVQKVGWLGFIKGEY
jgi:hypothetical protein